MLMRITGRFPPGQSLFGDIWPITYDLHDIIPQQSPKKKMNFSVKNV